MSNYDTAKSCFFLLHSCVKILGSKVSQKRAALNENLWVDKEKNDSLTWMTRI